MSDNIVALKRDIPASEVVATLRRIADDIEGGDPDWPVTTAVLLLGHAYEKPDGADRITGWHLRTHGVGPRADVFTVRGMLASALSGFGDD